MARIELLVDDMDGTTERSRPVETHRFGVDGEWYEIDLHAENAAAMQQAFAQYVERGRPVRKMVSVNHPANKRPVGEKMSTRGRPKGRVRMAAQVDKAQLDAERSWLRSQGHQVSNFGRIRSDLHELFVAAHLPSKSGGVEERLFSEAS